MSLAVALLPLPAAHAAGGRIADAVLTDRTAALVEGPRPAVRP